MVSLTTHQAELHVQENIIKLVLIESKHTRSETAANIIYILCLFRPNNKTSQLYGKVYSSHAIMNKHLLQLSRGVLLRVHVAAMLVLAFFSLVLQT